MNEFTTNIVKKNNKKKKRYYFSHTSMRFYSLIVILKENEHKNFQNQVILNINQIYGFLNNNILHKYYFYLKNGR